MLTSSAQIKYNEQRKIQNQLARNLHHFARKPYATKTQRKQAATDKRLDKELTPTVSDKLMKGYISTMNFLRRGCNVQAA